VEARARRAAAAVALAAALVAAVGAFYLQPWQAFAPAPQRPAAPRPSPAPSATVVQQMQFVSANVGWIVTGSAGSASLLRTGDGGRHWTRQLEGVAGDGWALLFLDAQRGVVYGADLRGAEVWRTMDGGRHWTRAVMPCLAPPLLVFFRDLDHGWCLAPSLTSVPGGPPAPLVPERQAIALYRTADGGAHWSQVLATNQDHPASNGLGDDGQKTWIWFQDEEIGWIGQRTQGSSAAVYATTDGGDHWSRQELTSPQGGWGTTEGMWEDGPQAVGGGAAPWLVVSAVTAVPQPNAVYLAGRYLYRWRSPAWTGPTQVPVGSLPAVVGADPSHWLVAIANSILSSTHGGEHWQAQGQVPAGWVISRFAMTDPDHGWALVFASSAPPLVTPQSRLARSVDGGRHWTLMAVPS
jgi:photosystem II stability/assembly factor-like uncharacterized protein